MNSVSPKAGFSIGKDGIEFHRATRHKSREQAIYDEHLLDCKVCQRKLLQVCRLAMEMNYHAKEGAAVRSIVKGIKQVNKSR